MAKRSVSLKGLKQDLKEGLDNRELMEKYSLSEAQLGSVFQKAVQKGGLTREEIDGRGGRSNVVKPPPAQEDSSPAVWRPPDDTAEFVAYEDEAPKGRRFPWIKISLLALAVLVVLAIKYLPLWASLGLIIIVPVAGWLIIGRLIKSFFMSGFEAKGKVLKDAQVEIHRLQRAKPPKLDDDEVMEEIEEMGPLDWYFLDVTIIPESIDDGFTHWAPGDLQLVGMDAKPKDMEEETEAYIWDYRVRLDGKFQEDETEKYKGPQRTLFHVGIPPEVKTLQFRYYFELFGEISFHTDRS
jgi:hypothetical protein